MSILVYDEIWLREPRLMVPGQKPIGPVIMDPRHWVTQAVRSNAATSVCCLFNRRSNYLYNEATGGSITSKSIEQGASYWDVKHGNLVRARNDGGYGEYFSSVAIDDTVKDWFVFLVFSNNVALDTAWYYGVFNKGSSPTTGAPYFAMGSNKGTPVTFKILLAGTTPVQGISGDVNVKHSVFLSGKGTTHFVYVKSSDGTIKTATTVVARTNAGANNALNIGSSYNMQANYAFEQFIYCSGYCPPVTAGIELADNPYQFLIPA